MKKRIPLLLLAFLLTQSVFAQQNAKDQIRSHIKQLRTIADSLEKAVNYMPDNVSVMTSAEGRNDANNAQKRIFVDAEHRVFWQAELPVYLSLSSKPDGSDGTRMKAQKIRQMETFSDPMYWEGHGVHHIKHIDERPGREVTFEIFVDGLAPASLIELKHAPKYVGDGKVFYGKNLAAEIRTIDEMSGTHQTFFAVDSAAFQVYQAPVKFEANKEYSLSYYGTDRVGNVEKIKNVRFIYDTESPTSTHKIIGEQLGDVLSPTTTFELASSDKSAGVSAIKYRFNDAPFQNYTTPININTLHEGEHTLHYYAIDKVSNEEEVKMFTFYLDKTPPHISAEIVGDQHQNRGRVFISNRTTMRLVATDEKAGLSKVYYTIDGGVEKLYTEPFPLSKGEGMHSIKYFAFDKVKNKTEASTNESYQNIYLDLSMPHINHNFIGPTVTVNDTLYITSKTKININALDNDSGIKKTGYKIDGLRSSPYTEPFIIEEEGHHLVEYYAMDNVNNRVSHEFHIIVDNQGPEIQTSFSMKPIGSIRTDDLATETSVYSLGTFLFISATDAKVGIQKIYYAIDDNPETLYTAPIQLKEKGIRNLKVRAIDQLGNEIQAHQISFFIK